MAVEIDLSGKCALVTGASRGIGRAIALVLGEAGASVGVNYRAAERAAREVCAAIGADRSHAIQADVGNRDDVRRMVETFMDRFGRIDILVNNAAIYAINRFEDGDYEAWDRGWRRTFDVNVFGLANTTYLAMDAMRRQGGGKIIHVASRAAYRGETEFADYGASKAAVVNLTISIARACARDGITANCIAPGFIETDMAADEIAKHHDEVVAQVPMGYIGSPRDVAGAALFLASPLADYVNGVTIDVNGGSWFH